MNSREWKRHEQRKARQRAAASGVPAWGVEPELRGTRMAVLPLDDGPQVRRLELDAEDPLPAVVRWCRRALLEAAPVECVRLVVVKNWDEDERELLDIPEARAYFRRLWLEGRELLRLLSESAWSPLPDDSYGLSAEVLSGLGMGWLDVYLAGFADVLEQEQYAGEYGPVYAVTMGGVGAADRELLRRELLETSDDNPGGLAWDAVSARARFMERHAPALRETALRLRDEGKTDHVLFVVSLLDAVGREMIVRLTGDQAAREHLERCRPDDMHPGAVVAAPRAITAALVGVFAPQAAAIVAEPAGDGSLWVLTIAEGGTQVGRFAIPEDVTA